MFPVSSKNRKNRKESGGLSSDLAFESISLIYGDIHVQVIVRRDTRVALPLRKAEFFNESALIKSGGISLL